MQLRVGVNKIGYKLTCLFLIDTIYLRVTIYHIHKLNFLMECKIFLIGEGLNISLS